MNAREIELRLIARKFRDGESLMTTQEYAHLGRQMQYEAKVDMVAKGFTLREVLDEVVEIDIEEEDVK